MYWPLGAPRVFAAPKKRTSPTSNEDSSQSQDDQTEEDPALLGLRVSRNGQLFATITKTALHIWQTAVG